MPNTKQSKVDAIYINKSSHNADEGHGAVFVTLIYNISKTTLQLSAEDGGICLVDLDKPWTNNRDYIEIHIDDSVLSDTFMDSLKAKLGDDSAWKVRLLEDVEIMIDEYVDDQEGVCCEWITFPTTDDEVTISF